MDVDTYLLHLTCLRDEGAENFHPVPGAPSVRELFALHTSPWDEVDAFLHDFETIGGA